jgi:DNA helicase-2/ATP-dependent DNA helicase PcrA
MDRGNRPEVLVIDLSSLNDEQRQAVTHGSGPLLVISAAGSGKTRCLTYRAAHLVKQGIPAHRVMLCTFTKKAATEMAERVTALCAEAMNLRVGTMHSLLFRVLRDEGYPFPELRDDSETNLRDHILDEYGQKRLLKDLIGRDAEADLADVIAQIGLWKNELTTREQAFEADPFTAEVWDRYEEHKAEHRLIDMDDMIVAAVRLFEDEPSLLHRHRPDWLLVDEAQDTSAAQWRALELLTGTADRNLTCVADWRQAIYSWRGARPEAILDFEQRFPGAVVIGLPRNYRSTSSIVSAANVLIRHAGRSLEDMVPTRPAGTDPAWTVAEDSDVEAIAVASEIQAQLEAGRRPRDFAILYRLNAYSRAFEEALAECSIPYTVVGSKGFFGRKEVADVVAYLSLAVDPDDEESLRRIANKPTRYLGKKWCDAVVAVAKRERSSLVEAIPVAGSRLSARQASAARLFAPTWGSWPRHVARRSARSRPSGAASATTAGCSGRKATAPRTRTAWRRWSSSSTSPRGSLRSASSFGSSRSSGRSRRATRPGTACS